MSTQFKAILASAVMVAATAVTLTATPAQAVTPQCNSTVTITSSYNGMTVYTKKASYNGSTNCWLERGSSGPAVAALQKSLLECSRTPVVVDGKFGPATQQSLKDHQATINRLEGKTVVTADGNYGPQTRYWMAYYGYGSGGYHQCASVRGTYGGV